MKIWEKAAQTAEQAAELMEEQARFWVLGQLKKAAASGRLQGCFREEEYRTAYAQEMADGFIECMDDDSVLPHRSLHAAKCCYEYLMEWFGKIAEVLSQDGEQITIHQEYLPADPLTKDPNIELVKMLHKGATKEEISRKLQITQRAVQEKLAALNGKRKMPLRVGGQALHVNVSDRRIDPDPNVNKDIDPDVRDDSRRKTTKKNTKEYHTWNTMHPVTLQLNMMQLWTLFRALALYQSKGYMRGDDIAKDIWMQLSEYGQEKLEALAEDRLMEQIMPLDEDVNLLRYLNNIQAEELADFHGFRTERDLLDNDDNIYREAYVMFYKAGRKCSIEYGRYPDEKRLEHQIIVNYKNGVLSFRDAEDKTAPVTEVLEGEISYMELCE